MFFFFSFFNSIILHVLCSFQRQSNENPQNWILCEYCMGAYRQWHAIQQYVWIEFHYTTFVACYMAVYLQCTSHEKSVYWSKRMLRHLIESKFCAPKLMPHVSYHMLCTCTLFYTLANANITIHTCAKELKFRCKHTCSTHSSTQCVPNTCLCRKFYPGFICMLEMSRYGRVSGEKKMRWMVIHRWCKENGTNKQKNGLVCALFWCHV